jgi:capsular polysaccharide export protein
MGDNRQIKNADTAPAAGNNVVHLPPRRPRKPLVASAAPASLNILLLQGPVGPFFRDLQATLENAGHRALHVIFNAADWYYSSGKNIVNYRGSIENWPRWLATTVEKEAIDAIVIFGCERDRHVAARELAAARDIPLISLEEGYIRPGYITAEEGGNNRFSPLAAMTTNDFLKKPTEKRLEPTRGHSYNRMGVYGMFYFIIRALGIPFFWSASHHKRRPLISEFFCWNRNLLRKITRRSRNFAMVEELLERYSGRYFLVPLQVRDDMQLVKAGRGWTNERLISEAIASFAQHAPKTHLLVFKVHPLERGHGNTPRAIATIAQLHGVQQRVRCLDDGSIGLLTRDCAGMLTVNSTSAFSAMLRRVPLGVLGDAMFRKPDLAWCIETPEHLDAYWTRAKSAKKSVLNGFRQHLAAKALIPGDYYLRRNRLVACEGLLKLIERKCKLTVMQPTAPVRQLPLLRAGQSDPEAS